MSAATVTGIVEKLLLYADYCEGVDELADSARELHDEIRQILPLVEAALFRAGDDERLRADLEEIRTAAVRAIMKTRMLTRSAANADVV